MVDSSKDISDPLQGAVAGGAALGLGALAFYGLGMSSEAGAVDRAVAWPQYVRDRVRALTKQ